MIDNSHIVEADTLLYSRISVPQVMVGSVAIGGDYPIVIQSMTNTNTNMIDDSVAQCKRIFDAGADMVRLTAQGEREAQALQIIKGQLVRDEYSKPLIADIHYNPKAALISAQYIEKVRINPGNYINSSKTEWTDEEYNWELETIRHNLRPLIAECTKYNVAIRVGVNHGSLSKRIIARYGNTPEGMVESMMEFVKIFKEEGFDAIVCSVKSSNTRTMVHAYRLLAQRMKQENSIYPLHIGVTEAGADEDGRIKSAVGIGTLLLDGIGDTIRVSLTEAPEKEIPVCREIVAFRNEVFSLYKPQLRLSASACDYVSYNKKQSDVVHSIGGEFPPIVCSQNSDTSADWIISDTEWRSVQTAQSLPVYSLEDYSHLEKDGECIVVIHEHEIADFDADVLRKGVVILFKTADKAVIHQVHDLYKRIAQNSYKPPVILGFQMNYQLFETVQIRSSVIAGSLFLDGFLDGLLLESEQLSSQEAVELSFSILQASRARFSKTEFISCPSCGRTLFNIEDSLSKVKARTAHLKGLKIAVMGCVVNGPGEMADADYGYIGAGSGKVNLYRKQELVFKGISEDEAIEKLVQIIWEHGDWVEVL
ncbi:MAG: (E)-4-hydroxy-3-methylbut-2-enyl-diphosphate synthase [Bacteroidales bacterium]|jgi:(E)-4-hydroxy-3-methylbut-2-enyl-diphosphate synthase|nr:(E)-4-hydroxy-3-methylbut-2-enyl-diphosphate synthase [Bacteroidales bacterium]